MNEQNRPVPSTDHQGQISGDLVVDRQDCGARGFPALERAPVEELSAAELITALQSCFWEIRHRVPSAWGEHIPLMFSLMTLARPRVYVELGVHNGASFLAACQAAQSRDMDTICVAIDNWLGDAHAGAYRDDVFDAFLAALRPYDGFAGYMRADFDRAAGQFEKGSIDLLHIDGLHTASAVMNDFETWLPKMSDRGIVLFHDTNEFRADFGVWRFWRNIREKYPYLEFGHGHGLGVLLVGEANALRRPIDGLGMPMASPLVNELLQVIFGGVGHLAWHRSPPQQANPVPGHDPEHTRQLQDLVARQEATINALQSSTSWKITAPLRAIVTRLRGR